MNLLIIGSSSSIAKMAINNLKIFKNVNIITIGRSDLKKPKHFIVKNYSEKSISKVIKKLKSKKIIFDATIFFNGYHKASTLTFFNTKLFNKILKINIIVPFKILSELIKNGLLKKKSSVLFISSLAAELNEVGNAYYSIAKSILNKSIKIIKNEQKANLRFNIISLGMVKNKMTEKMIKNFPGIFKNKNQYINNKVMLQRFRKVIFSKKINNRIIKIHGKYKN